MANSKIYTAVTGTASTETIAAATITFPYLKKSHLEVRVSNAGETLSAFKIRLAAGSVTAETFNTDYSIADSGILTFVTATLADGSVYQVEVKRNSNILTRYVDFVDGSIVTEANLDDAQKQQLYVSQELEDNKATLKEDGSITADITGDITGNAATATLAATVTTNANLTGEVTSSGNAATITDNIVDEANLKSDNAPTNDYVLTAKSSASGGLTWASAGAGTVTSVTAGAGMTQSGTSTVNPTLDVVGGDGITANANDIAHTAHTGDVTGATALTIAADAVNGDKIADLSINSEHFVLGSIDASAIAADAVNGDKIADLSINSEHFVTGSIDTAHIAADAVNGDKIADLSINSEHFVNGSIDAAHIAADAVNGDKIADLSINSEHYINASIDLAHMSSESVDEDNLYISNSGSNGQFLSKQSGDDGGLTWASVSGASTATASATGVIKIEDDTDQSVAAESVSTTANRTYGLQLNSSDQGVTNVPWTDTNTTYTAGDGLDLSGTSFSTDLKSAGGLKITSTELELDVNGLADVGTTTFGVATFGAGDYVAVADASDSNNPKKVKMPVELGMAISDEATALTTGTAKLTFRMPHAMTLTSVRSNVNTAPTGATLVVDINEGGSTILSTKLSIDISEKTSTTAATPAVISDTALADDAEITVDIDQIGSSVAGKGLKIWLIGYR